MFDEDYYYNFAQFYPSELIYYCEYIEDDWDNRFEILFSNKYKVTSRYIKMPYRPDYVEKDEIFLTFHSIESNVNDQFFGENILNITAIVGKNGTGKTNIFRGITAKNNTNVKTIQVYKGNFNFEEYTCTTNSESENIHVFMEEKIKKPTHTVASNIKVLFLGSGLDAKLSTDNPMFKVLKPSPLDLYTCLTKDSLFRENFSFITEYKRKFFIIDLTKSKDTKFLLESGLQARLSKLILFNNLSFNGKVELVLLLTLSIFTRNNKTAEVHDAIQSDQMVDYNLIFRLQTVLFKEEILVRTKEWKDKYSKHVSVEELFNELLVLFKKIPDQFLSEIKNYFEKGCLAIEITEWNDEIFSFLNVLDSFLPVREDKSIVFEYDFGGYSAGENELLQTIASIKTALKEYDIERDISVILCIDEYETYLHPEWARKYLDYLLKVVSDADVKIKTQLVITTHSPYLISDLPKENIRLITKDEITGKREVSIPKHGFASNYYDILSDSFFLEDTIGEFAKQKINSWITELNNLEESALSDPDKLERIDEIKKLIMIVDDQFIRNKLLGLADDVKNKIIKNADKGLQESLIDAEIAKLEAMKERLRTEEKND